MDKIAIISDIHGNLEALTVTLKDIRKRGISTIYCLGDIIWKGSHSKECLQLIKENCQVVIKGNCEEYFMQNPDNKNLDEIDRSDITWIQERLTKEDCEYLANLPFSYEFYMSGSLIRLFHSGPTKTAENIFHYDKIETKKGIFLPSENTKSNEVADVVIFGHVHTPFLEQLYNKTLINVGSVGNSLELIRDPDFNSKDMETTRAVYLIIEGILDEKDKKEEFSMQFIKVPYDIEKELNSESENRNIEKYIEELREGKYRNLGKIRKLITERKLEINI